MINIDGVMYGIIKQKILSKYRRPTKAVLAKVINDHVEKYEV